MRSKMAFDTDKMLIEIRKYPALWDTTSGTYKCKDSKQSAWNSVALQVVDGFAHLSEIQKDKAIRCVQQRWKSARDQYLRKSEKIKKSGGKYNTRYIYADVMTFLDPLTPVDVTEPVAVTVAADVCSATLSDHSPPVKRLKRRRRESTDMNRFEEELVDIWRENATRRTDDDSEFFNSLLPTVRGFSTQQKLEFRCRVLQLAMEINLQNISTAQNPNNSLYQDMG